MLAIVTNNIFFKKKHTQTENLSFAEKASALSIPLAVNYKLVIPPKKFDIETVPYKYNSNSSNNNDSSDNSTNNSSNNDDNKSNSSNNNNSDVTNNLSDSDFPKFMTIIPPSLPPSLITAGTAFTF